MCVPGLDPISLAAIAASGAGAAYNANVNNQYVDAMNAQNNQSMIREGQAAAEERTRQAQFEADQTAQVMNTLFQVAPEKVQTDAADVASDPHTSYVTAADEYNLGRLDGQVHNDNVTKVIGQTVGDAARETRGILSAAATLAGQSDSFAQSGDALGRMGSELQTLGGFRSGSMNASQLETSIPAAQVTKSYSPIGDLLMLGGTGLAGHAGNLAGLGGATSQPLSAIPWLNG